MVHINVFQELNLMEKSFGMEASQVLRVILTNSREVDVPGYCCTVLEDDWSRYSSKICDSRCNSSRVTEIVKHWSNCQQRLMAPNVRLTHNKLWKGGKQQKKHFQGQRKLKQNQTRRPTNWWGGAKRDVTHSTATVVYNACDHFLRKRSCITRFAWANWPQQQHDTSHLCNA